ncbi:MAG TPA: cytochrome c oxidase subunit II [Gaiellaceae bacterium]|nr:cytochrome c oxidase subunit II [Gaiellaceae bacterium]
MITWFRVGCSCVAATGFTVAATGCGNQSTLAPDSHASHDISNVWWAMLVGSAVIFAVVVAILAFGLLRRRGQAPADRRPLRSGTWMVAVGGLALPLVVLVVLFAATIKALPATSATGQKTSFTIDVTGRQWFWDVSYPGHDFRTANEIHIPVGESVLIKVTSADVIHSLWVPALNRKIDVIPGKTNEVVFHATHAGVFRGQCAEFCGLEHAHMALLVVAQPLAAYESWLNNEERPPPPPPTPELEQGQQIFLGSDCEYCHAIAGTNASGTIGPDLSHFASRLAIGADTLPNGEGYLAGWLLDPQHFKPGTQMPATALSGTELQALLAYLESLR